MSGREKTFVDCAQHPINDSILVHSLPRVRTDLYISLRAQPTESTLPMASCQLDSLDMALDGIGPSFAQLFGVSARVSAPPYSCGHPRQQNTYHAFHDLMHVLP